MLNAYKQAFTIMRLDADKKTFLEERYLPLLEHLHKRCKHVSGLFYTNRLIITIGSIIVPALLSIQYRDGGQTTTITIALYWLTWSISLLVTVSNGILTMFKFDKKYYLLHTTFEQLKTEGWQFYALTGRYKLHQGETTAPTHESRFQLFSQTVERIYVRQVEEEFIRMHDSAATGGTAPQQAAPGNTAIDIPSLVETYRTPSTDDFMYKLVNLIRSQIEKKEKNTIEGSPASNENKTSKETSVSPRSVISPNWGAESVSV